MIKLDKVLLIILILVIIVLAGAIIWVNLSPKPGDKFTEFYLLNQDGKASGYPAQTAVGQPVTVIIGVVNHERAPLNYRIEATVANGAIIKSLETGMLSDGQKWEQKVDLVLNQAVNNQKVEFYLYPNKETKPLIKDPLVLLLNVIE
jgi:uncharacterized membrane protein